MLQTILIPKSFTLEDANKWMILHNYPIKKIDSKHNYYRYRQEEPPQHAVTYFSKKLSNGIILVYYI